MYVVILNQLSNVVMLNVYVFHSFVVLSVLNKVQAGLIITQNLYKCWRLVHRYSNKEATKLHCLPDSMSDGDVLSFSSGS